MKAHLSTLHTRLIRAALRSSCLYRVAAVGFDYRSRIIAIAINAPRAATPNSRGWHAEERLMHRAPKSLVRIEIIRIGASGRELPIDPCAHCRKLAERRGVEITMFAKGRVI